MNSRVCLWQGPRQRSQRYVDRVAIEHEMVGFIPVIAKDLNGQVDNSAYPASPFAST